MIYYQDDYATIYHSPYQETEADTIVLDPPHFLENVRDFEANTMFIFAGRMLESYIKLLFETYLSIVHWKWIDKSDEYGRAIVHEDVLLMVGINGDLFGGTHLLPPEREVFWERPVGLVIDLLELSRGNVLDPFMGSGSTLVASKILKRKCVGYDIDEKCCEIAVERLRRIE